MRLDLANPDLTVDCRAEHLLDVAAVVFDLRQDCVAQGQEHQSEGEVTQRHCPEQRARYDPHPRVGHPAAGADWEAAWKRWTGGSGQPCPRSATAGPSANQTCKTMPPSPTSSNRSLSQPPAGSARPALAVEVEFTLQQPVSAAELSAWLAAQPVSEANLKPVLRQLKQRAYVRIAARDLAGLAPRPKSRSA